MFKELRTNFRRIRGLIWFDQVDRGVDWPLETSPAAASAFAKGVAWAWLPGQRPGRGGGEPDPATRLIEQKHYPVLGVR